MAKKKTSKRKNNKGTALIFGLIILLFVGLGIALFLSLDSAGLYVGEKFVEDSAYNGLKLAFGYKTTTTIPLVGTEIITTYLNPSVGLIIALVLAVIGAVLALPRKKLLNLLGGLLLIGAAVLFIFAGNMTALTDDMKELHSVANQLTTVAYKSLIGSYLACAFVGLGGIIALIKPLIKR